MSIEPLVRSNIEALELGAELIAGLDQGQYAAAVSPVSSASVGSHIRHILEHYQRFFAGLGEAAVNYDARARASELETNRNSATRGVRCAIDSLQALLNDRFDLDSGLQVTLQTTAAAASTPEVSSTVGRELVFLHGHTTHHFAQLALQLRAIGVVVPRTFGMAPSTQSYEAGLVEQSSVMAAKS